jgi:hypothetical protein
MKPMQGETKKFSIVKPTVDTPFHIDFSWWKEHDNNWRVFLVSCLCPEHRPLFEEQKEEVQIDWVNPETAEVTRLDGLQHILMSHCAKQPGFLTNDTPLVDLVFRVFLTNGNSPLSPSELAQQLNQSSSKILQTFGGMQVYRGIRPYQK